MVGPGYTPSQWALDILLPSGPWIYSYLVGPVYTPSYWALDILLPSGPWIYSYLTMPIAGVDVPGPHAGLGLLVPETSAKVDFPGLSAGIQKLMCQGPMQEV